MFIILVVTYMTKIFKLCTLSEIYVLERIPLAECTCFCIKLNRSMYILPKECVQVHNAKNKIHQTADENKKSIN